MDISPVSAIGPVTRIQSGKSAPDLSRVFEVEYLGQSGDDEYSPRNGKASRGLEDESEDDEAEALTETGTRRGGFSSLGVSLFA